MTISFYFPKTATTFFLSCPFSPWCLEVERGQANFLWAFSLHKKLDEQKNLTIKTPLDAHNNFMTIKI